MMFRRKLLAVLALTVCVSVGAVTALVLAVTRRAFEKTEEERIAALVAQFQREFNRQGDEAVRRIQAIAVSEAVTRMATVLDHSPADSAGYFDLARSMADNYQVDFLEFVDARGTIISSAQWPAKFGYPESGFENLPSASDQGAFLMQQELQDSTALGLLAVRSTRVGEHPIYVIGGRRLDRNFLTALDLPPDMRTLLYQNRGDRFSPDLLIDPSAATASGLARPADKFAPLVEAVRQYNQETTWKIQWSSDQADDELFHAIPLRGIGKDRPLLGILLIGNLQRSYVELKRHIGLLALLVGGGGILLAILLSSWAAARVTRPVEQLVRAAQNVAAGNWNTRVEAPGADEISQLAESFNRMTAELLSQRERLVQAERVAAWRELARRLAHELKNPLFPLQLTVENLVRARQQSPQQFEEVFRESSRTLLAEISNLKAIISRFSEFSKMPHPELQTVPVNDLLRAVAQLFQAQLQAPGREPITCRLDLDESLAPIAADPELLHRALSNLVLNAMDAMPNGGTLTLRSRRDDGTVTIEVADTGSGLTREECERIFTPYYTSKQHGTGLGLAIVQSVVSDHGGRISVRSEPGQGTTFVIELPSRRDALPNAPSAQPENAGHSSG
ncbi:Integral membrane sensor signal transduction histidine kinase [Candidatus Sulfotelmatobacter kueseliae]|uniref:histidine kinase n=1 Tax=Candidatus Sulfotelmatobacter kueseliae TaxID=2042962 RepID=A0A2U3L865_9BACT|nr:Integral membrane sensor signal transduction histidine kinase [Candidatus Sulfotelmatobacter kueseliae]